MRALHAGRKALAILAIALVSAVVAAILPDNSYQRWQLLDGTIHSRSRWIYERVHFDPTPIDVAFIGPSRIGAGVNAPRLSAALAARGLPANVVNFSLPETGRNINAAIVDEMLSVKRPRLIVIGVIEKPSRFGHSAFKYVAPRQMIVNPGYLGNANYLSDLIYLPFRQIRLFAADLWPGAMGLAKDFDARAYRGSSIDTTGDIVLPDGTLKNGRVSASSEELARGVAKLERGMNPPILPKSMADIEFGDERYFIDHIVRTARSKGVPVAFLALPYYTGPATLQEQSFYAARGPILNAAFLRGQASLYGDYGHLTSGGAVILTDWLDPRIAAILKADK